MICVSLAEESTAACLEALKNVAFAEIRLDLMDLLSMDDVRRIFSRHPKLIATCRAGKLTDIERKAILIEAISAGAAYVDVELDAPQDYRKEIIGHAKSNGCKVIISFHNHEETPNHKELEHIEAECFRAGGDIAKIACMVHSDKDNQRLLTVLGGRSKTVVIGMGEKGKMTRVVAPLLGNPFTFASLSKGKETAEGQMDKQTLERYMRVISGVVAKGEGT
jgi:3-dehydroquinate dehydratase type I